MVDKVREIALKILYKIDEQDGYSNIVLNESLKQNKKELDDRDIGFISEIIYGVTTWRLTLDEIIKKYSNIKLKKISPWILNILRMGIYQIIFLDKVPKSAAVNESVTLAKRYGHKGSSNFVNAVLRKVNKEDYEDFFSIEDDIERISKTTSMPEWIINELLKEKNIEEVEQICKASNIRPNIAVRINKLKISKEELIRLLNDKNINFKEGFLDDFLILDRVKNIEQLDIFKRGYITVQDEGAGMIALILDPKPNEKILDACSSPGGKTTYLAELMDNKGEITAWDLYEHRVNLVDKAAKRLGINIIDAECQDATIYNEKYKEKFDKILLDVPCLGIGVLKRKPDIKWKRKKEDIEEITKIQRNILDTCSKYLKHNGELVYSTCSIFLEENENIINEFLKKNNQFEFTNINSKVLNKYGKKLQNNAIIKLYQSTESDGFFMCKLIKK